MGKKNQNPPADATASEKVVDTTVAPEKVEPPATTNKPEMTKSAMVRAARDSGHQTNDEIRQFVRGEFGCEVTNSCIWSALNGSGERRKATKTGGLTPDQLLTLHAIGGRIGEKELQELVTMLETVSAGEISKFLVAIGKIAQNGQSK